MQRCLVSANACSVEQTKQQTKIEKAPPNSTLPPEQGLHPERRPSGRDRLRKVTDFGDDQVDADTSPDAEYYTEAHDELGIDDARAHQLPQGAIHK